MAEHRIYVGTMPDGRQVLVQLWGETGQVAFRDHPGATWGVPTAVTEEAAS